MDGHTDNRRAQQHSLKFCYGKIFVSVHPYQFYRSYRIFQQAFFLPNAGRQNLTVLTHAWANKVLTTSDENKTVKATGVEFEHGSKVHIVRAKKEVILCAGLVIRIHHYSPGFDWSSSFAT